jgi:hypothetical protein
MLSNGRKNCAAMSHSTGTSSKVLYAFLAEAKIHTKKIEEQLFLLAKETREEDILRALIVDPTTLIKLYAEKIQKLCYDRSGCTKHTERCLVPIYIAVADKNITIPLNLEFWVQEKITSKRRYKSKAKITQELIVDAINKDISFDFIALDGAYAVPKMFTFFQKNKNLKFIIRIPRNRRVEMVDGTLIQLQKHPLLMLKRNERSKTVQAKMYGETYFFTAQKRKKRGGGWETVFLVSNMNLPAKEQVAAYALRWPVEKGNRTTKQKFGSTQCQTLETSKQKAHIMAGFFSYAILSLLKNDKESQSVDDLVNKIRDLHFDELIESIKKPAQSKRHLSIDPVENPFQNYFKILQDNNEQVRNSMR